MMSDNGSTPQEKSPPTERNPVTTATFRRESARQIIWPVVGTALAGTGLIVLLGIFGGAEGIAVAADYSLGLLAVLTVVTGLLLVVVFAALIYGVGYLLNFIPPYTNIAHQSADKIYKQVDHYTTKITDQVIAFQSMLVGLDHYLRQQGVITDEKPEKPETPS